ncbi:MAG TPA: ferredoxin--NADP reductase [Puia sp.]|nr:ferredoxin--NADP reductase [Puia sp.]
MDLLVLKVIAIVPEAKDTATIYLARADGQELDYRSGQFLTFLLVAGRELRRSYSFSSTPGVDPVAAITVKRVINGEVSRYLLDHLRVGDEMASLPPSGRFVLEAPAGQPRQLFFIAAGSGMAPVFSLLKEALVKEPASRVVLISQHHDEASILFKEPLEDLIQKYGDRLRWVNFLSSPEDRKILWKVGMPADARHREGRLNNWLLEELLGELLVSGEMKEAGREAGALFYLCGPPAFMRMAQFTLRVMGFDHERIKQEHFTVEYVPPPPLLTDTTPKKITILSGSQKASAGGSSLQFETAWPNTILQAALSQGVSLPYSCRGGRCSTCVARCISGKVKMSINEVLTEKDLLEGLVLTCVGYAETDVILELS